MSITINKRELKAYIKIENLQAKNKKLMKLMDSLVNFDACSDEKARAYFIKLIQDWYVENQDSMHEFRMNNNHKATKE